MDYGGDHHIDRLFGVVLVRDVKPTNEEMIMWELILALLGLELPENEILPWVANE